MSRHSRLGTMALLGLLALSRVDRASAQAPPAGTIFGRVTLSGPPPAPQRVKLGRYDPTCGALHPEGLAIRTIAVTRGGVANAFVWLKSGVSGSFPVPAGPAVLDQRGCVYVPHVMGVRTGQAITIRNSDDTLHSIHPRPRVNAEFHIGQPRQGMTQDRTFDKQEVMIPISCAVHPWMTAYVAVVDHPYFAVTRRDGTYEIPGVPPGDYEIEVVHEELKSQARRLTVKAGPRTLADFALQR